MGLEIIETPTNVPSDKLVSDRPLFADAALTTLLEEGDETASFQLASRAGKTIHSEYVEALNLGVDKKGRVVQLSAEKKESVPAENKEAAPAENKAVAPPKPKSPKTDPKPPRKGK